MDKIEGPRFKPQTAIRRTKVQRTGDRKAFPAEPALEPDRVDPEPPPPPNRGLGGGTVDQLIVEAMSRENLWAFGDLTAPGPGAGLSGMIKLNKPKPGRNRRTRLALMFILDAPEPALIQAARAALDPFDDPELENRLPHTERIDSLPGTEAGGELFLKRVDLIYPALIRLDRGFVEQILLPALAGAIGLTVTGLTWWSDEPTAPAPSLPSRTGRRVIGQYQQIRGAFLPPGGGRKL